MFFGNNRSNKRRYLHLRFHSGRFRSWGDVACMTGALWAKRGERDISRGARHDPSGLRQGSRAGSKPGSPWITDYFGPKVSYESRTSGFSTQTQKFKTIVVTNGYKNAPSQRLRIFRNWRAFLETPETFRAYFGCHNFLRILKTKTFQGIKFCNKFALSYLEIIVKGQLFRISGSQFLKWLFGPEKFTGLSGNGPLVRALDPRRIVHSGDVDVMPFSTPDLFSGFAPRRLWETPHWSWPKSGYRDFKAHARLTISGMVLHVLFDKVLDFALRKAGKDSDFSLKAQQKEIIETIARLKKLRMC